MLYLQRASAGSGKTYALTRKYIEMLITIQRENQPTRLRTIPELKDSMSHILAITFTNKATREMQARIVKRLAELAEDSYDKKPEYLEYFTADHYHFEEEKLREVCKRALALMLHNYSDFQVSTIDSFFQTVLRTFAMETDLNDSYQVELDSTFLNRVGLDLTLSDINTPNPDAELSFWVSYFMKSGVVMGSNGNLFRKSSGESKGFGKKKNASEILIDAAKKMSSEEFKFIRDDLDKYFEDYPEFSKTFTDYDQKIYDEIRQDFEAMVKGAKEFIEIMPKEDDEQREALNKSGCSRFPKMASALIGVDPGFKPGNGSDDIIKKDARSLRKISPELAQRLKEKGAEVFEHYFRWIAFLKSEKIKLWKIYKENLAYLGLMNAIRRNTMRYLEENNMIELAETNMLLRKVIGDDDVPFVYERIGSRLEHFLIDEFQDTSRMQWDNLRPLLVESMGRGKESLIIGDAKQSIYRFRNADSSLISSVVPEDEYLTPQQNFDNLRETNTNHRSECNIVKFNNSLFNALAKSFDELENEGVEEAKRDSYFSNIYSNAIQPIPEKKLDTQKGYVEVRFVKKAKDDSGATQHLEQIGPLIHSLLERNWKQRDIAILASTHEVADSVIDRLTNYNATLEPDKERIEIISEESLKVSNAKSIRILISTLGMLVVGSDPQLRNDDEDKVKKGVADVSNISAAYRYFCLQHPEYTDTATLMEQFLKQEKAEDILSQLLESMQSVALPAVVEALIERFVPQALRYEEAPYLAAFQDIVLDYCENYSADVASFLEYWENKGKKMSISAPETTNAVSVMTIHKAKGLEFGCVILPWLDEPVKPSSNKKEWRWVEPKISLENVNPLPPQVPITTSDALSDTCYKDVQKEYVRAYRADVLNKQYVAFTRAVDELYVFTNLDKDKMGEKLQTLAEKFSADAEQVAEDLKPYLADTDDISLQEIEDDVNDSLPEPMRIQAIMTFGHKELHENKEKKTHAVPISEYFVCSSLPQLTYKEGEMDSEEDDDDKTEPRRQGIIMHEIMSKIATIDDIPRAVLSAKARGLVIRSEAEEIEKMLKEKLALPRVKEWFKPGLKVITERKMTGRDRNNESGRFFADRIVISPDNELIVVDYKFGTEVKKEAHTGQVLDYLEILSKALPTRPKRASGFVFYVTLGKVIPVTGFDISQPTLFTYESE